MRVRVGKQITAEDLRNCPPGSVLTVYEHNDVSKCLTTLMRDTDHWHYWSSPMKENHCPSGNLLSMAWVAHDAHVDPLVLFIPEEGDIK